MSVGPAPACPYFSSKSNSKGLFVAKTPSDMANPERNGGGTAKRQGCNVYAEPTADGAEAFAPDTGFL